MNAVAYAALGTGFTFLLTSAGAAVVFFFKNEIKGNIQKSFLGFAAGVMVAASVWSLLIPAISEAEAMGLIGWVPAAIGFVAGGVFLFALDHLLPHLHLEQKQPEGLSSNWKKTTLLVSAVTLHNIPEGMAVGLAFAMSAQHQDPALMSAAMALAIGIGIQNFPEGAAISLPLRQEGFSRFKAFLYGSLSGIVEPIFGILTVLAASQIARFNAVAAFVCGWCDDLCRRGGTDSGSPSGGTYSRRHDRVYGRLSDHDDSGRRLG